MYKTVFVVLAMLPLSACASFAPLDALNIAAPSYAKTAVVIASHSVGVTSEPIGATDRDMDTPAVWATNASPALSRRTFGYPTRHQPDLRLVLATAPDRARFYRRRVRRARARRPCRACC